MKYIYSLIASFSLVWLIASIKYIFELSAPSGFTFFLGWMGGMAFNYVYNTLKEKRSNNISE